MPYFKYLLEGSIGYLTDDDGGKSVHSRKKKKAKLQSSESRMIEASDTMSVESWHLRALVLSALHKCFRYDSGSVKLLDSAKFELLLKPIVLQLAVKPPVYTAEQADIPSVSEVDDILVSCAGQMGVTAGSDLLWKPLNYEVIASSFLFFFYLSYIFFLVK